MEGKWVEGGGGQRVRSGDTAPSHGAGCWWRGVLKGKPDEGAGAWMQMLNHRRVCAEAGIKYL